MHPLTISKILEINICSCFVGYGFTSQENYSSQSCKDPSTTLGASFKDSWKLSIHRDTWSPTQLGHFQHSWGHDEGALSVLWSFTPLLHLSRLSTCAYFGRILLTLKDYHSRSTTFQRYRKRSKAKRDYSSSTLALIWYHNSLGNKEWCQRFPRKVLV